MRIYDTNQQPVSSGASQTRDAQKVDETQNRSSAGSVSRGGLKGDEVQLSDLGAQVAAGTESVDREARVAELAKLYRSGSYSVDAQAVSAKLIDDATIAR